MPLNQKQEQRLRANLEVIKQRHPQAVELLGNAGLVDGEPPVSELKQVSGSGVMRYVVMAGISSAACLKEFYSSHCHKIYRLVLVEPSPELLTSVLAEDDLSTILMEPRVRLLAGPMLQALGEVLGEDAAAVGTWGINLFAEKRIKEEHSDFLSHVTRMIDRASAVANDNMQLQLQQGKAIQTNILQNLPYIVRSGNLDSYKGSLEGFPAVVVGAGPSLNKNINLLSNLPPNVVLIAVDTATKPLLQRGIQPHVIASCDPTPLNARHFEGVRLPEETLFAYLPELYHTILPMIQPHRNLLCLHDHNSRLLGEYARSMGITTLFQRGMNVGFCSFSLARHLGCSPVVLMGMDLALEESRSHADGTANASDVLVNETEKTVRLGGNLETEPVPLLTVDGYYDAPVKTFPYFHTILQRFVREVTTMEGPVINATEGGAKIEGTRQMPLHEALQLCGNADAVLPPLPAANAVNPVPTLFKKALDDIYKGLAQNRALLLRGVQRLEQWRDLIGAKSVSLDDVVSSSERFMKQWRSILGDPSLNTGIDIGLARWRYETNRTETPEGLPPDELAKWWAARFIDWFASLAEEMQLYIKLYEWLCKSKL